MIPNHSSSSALAQAFQKQQAQQNGNPAEAKAAVEALLQKTEIREMLIRLRDK